MERSEAKKGHRKEESDKEKKGREGGREEKGTKFFVPGPVFYLCYPANCHMLEYPFY